MLFLLLGLMVVEPVEPRSNPQGHSGVVQLLGSRFLDRASVAAPNETDCNPPWIETPVGCLIFLHTEVDSWAGAQAECDSLGGFLVEAKSQIEVLTLSAIARVVSVLMSVDSWWLGLTDWAHEGTWVWIHSREESTVFHWARETDQTISNHQDCARMRREDDFKWSDTDCVFTKAAPICERNIRREKEEEDEEEEQMIEEIEEEGEEEDEEDKKEEEDQDNKEEEDQDDKSEQDKKEEDQDDEAGGSVEQEEEEDYSGEDGDLVEDGSGDH